MSAEYVVAVERARAILERWVDRQGHDRCWYYPEVFRDLCGVLGVEAAMPPGLPPREEFEAGRKRYQAEEYHG